MRCIPQWDLAGQRAQIAQLVGGKAEQLAVHRELSSLEDALHASHRRLPARAGQHGEQWVLYPSSGGAVFAAIKRDTDVRLDFVVRPAD